MPHGRTGIGYYTWQLVRRLPLVDPDTTFIAWYLDVRGTLGLDPRRRLFEDLEAPNLVDRRFPIPASWFDRVALRLDVPRLESMVRFDVLFAPNFVPPPTRTRALVLTVHDLAFRLFPADGSARDLEMALASGLGDPSRVAAHRRVRAEPA